MFNFSHFFLQWIQIRLCPWQCNNFSSIFNQFLGCITSYSWERKVFKIPIYIYTYTNIISTRFYVTILYAHLAVPLCTIISLVSLNKYMPVTKWLSLPFPAPVTKAFFPQKLISILRIMIYEVPNHGPHFHAPRGLSQIYRFLHILSVFISVMYS